MPASRGGPVAAGAPVRPSLPKAPPANTTTGANPRGVAITRPAPLAAQKPTVNDTAAKTLNTGANPRGVAIQQRSGGQGMRQAVRDVFLHQPAPAQKEILKGLQGKNVDPQTRLGIQDGVKALSQSQRQALAETFVGKSLNFDKLINAINPAKLATSGLASGNSTGPGVVPGAAAIQNPVQKYAKIGAELTGNALKDAVDTPAETFSTIGTLGSDVAGGHVGKAVNDLVSPYKQLVEHPGQTILQHPLNTYLMVAGPVHGLTRVGAGAVRALAPESAAGKALSTTREGIQLAGNLTHERPRASPYPLIKLGQKTVDAARYERAPTGELVPKSANLKAKLTGLETSRIIGVNERIRQANRDAVIAQRARAVSPGLAAKAAHGVKTALRYDPKVAALPGADVLARIADATIRRPDTFKEDLAKHLQQVSANRPNLIELPKLLKEHDAYVKALSDAAKRSHSAADVAKLFKAAQSYAEDYKAVQDEASKLGQFGSRSQDALLKRQLYHYAVTHMGATFDHEKGLVDSSGQPLGTSTILAHLNSKEGTGGRVPAFTSDKARRGSAFYISSERRPLPQNAQNTLFAYTHGLTHPGHEALMEQHVRMQGVVDAHKAQNRLISNVAVMKPDGSAWPSYQSALKDAPHGYVPIALSQPFHDLQSLDKAMEGTDPAELEREAQTHSLDLNARLNDTGQGRWGLVDENVLRRINEHTSQISSNPAMRALKMTNNQFRQVALGTSAKHVPGVISEQVIRDISSGVGLSSWLTGRRLLNRAEELNPELGRNARVQLTGGTVAGMTKAMMTKQVSDHFAGTNLYAPLKAFEAVMKAPGARQLRTAWKAWLKLAINGTKHYVEEQNQTAGLGKAALREFGSQHGPFFKALRLQGAMLDDAAKGLYDPKKLRQLRAEVENMYGRWTDLTPTGQNALMFSPFGLWWVNSVKWLLRSPIDRPVQTGALAAATTGTEKERAAQGLDLFAPNRVPLYMQGGVGLPGNKILAQNYYSPFGVANDPLETFASLIAPAGIPLVLDSLGVNYQGNKMNSPSNPHGDKETNPGQRAAALANSLFGLFIPLYTKAEQIAEGGASAYDSSTLLNPQTKTPGKGLIAGAEKALRPYRMYTNNPQNSGSGSSKPVIPGHGSVSGAVIPGHGSLSGAVIP